MQLNAMHFLWKNRSKELSHFYSFFKLVNDFWWKMKPSPEIRKAWVMLFSFSFTF